MSRGTMMGHQQYFGEPIKHVYGGDRAVGKPRQVHSPGAGVTEGRGKP
jgi:hypothetical protein